MTRREFVELIDSGVVILDGATGSVLQKKGMPVGVCPEKWILEHKDIMIELQKEYINAGSNIIYAPTFTGNRIKLAEYGLADDIERINTELVAISKKAIEEAGSDKKCYVCGDLTMTGEQLYPMGTLQFEELVDIYKEQLNILYKAGIDLVVVETMMSLQECRAAVLAVKETSDLPVMVTMSFNEDGRTLFGTDPVTAVNVLQSMGVDAVGANCSSGADMMLPIIEQMVSAAKIPVIAKPNCGMPVLVDGETTYSNTPEEFAEGVMDLVNAGAAIVGGCCGTNPECIANIKAMLNNIDEAKRREYVDNARNKAYSYRILSSERMSVDVAKRDKFYIIGERINPTGKKALQASLKEGSVDLVISMAEEQVEYGADILDVNVGMNGIDEKETMFKVVTELTQAVNLPLSIDTSSVEAMEYALRNYPGRALMNSISLDESKMCKLLPMAKKYGAMFVLLPLSEEGLPKNLDEKKHIIRTIVDEAKKYGLTAEDIVVDGLVTTVGANKMAAVETLETIRYCTDELGVLTVCGLSNISFGLPERSYVNAAFMAVAIKEGLTMAIANPMQELLMNITYATDLLLARPEADGRYVERVTVFKEAHAVNNVQEQAKVSDKSTVSEIKEDDADIIDKDIYDAVLKGRKETVLNVTKKAIDNGLSPEEIINGAFVPAINRVGVLFEKGRYFLPQLMSSAETMKIGMDYIEPMLAGDANINTKGVVVIATVKGDIHDIGKNLVAIMLKNCGYEVHDLGKNIEADDIIQAAREYNADIIGLSALMTTTMMEMKNVVDKVKEAGLGAKIMIGGAVVTESFADEIGADAYAKDAGEAVVVADKLIK